jgi:uncharacterized protein (TIGR02246 family)
MREDKIMSNHNKGIVEKVNSAFAENNLEGFLSLCANEIEWTIIGEKHVKGKEAIRSWMEAMEMEPPKFTVDTVIAEGDFVAAHGRMTMKDKDGKTAPYAYCDIYRIRNDQIVELISFITKTKSEK